MSVLSSDVAATTAMEECKTFVASLLGDGADATKRRERIEVEAASARYFASLLRSVSSDSQVGEPVCRADLIQAAGALQQLATLARRAGLDRIPSEADLGAVIKLQKGRRLSGWFYGAGSRQPIL